MRWLGGTLLAFFVLPYWLPAQTLQHRYSFTADASDSAGRANGTLAGNAYISNNAVVLPGGGTSDNPSGYVQLPNGIVSNDASITVECWLTDTAGSTWAEAWCFGDSAAGSGQPPNNGTAYISLIPHSGEDDLRGAFNLTGGDEIDVVGPANTPLPLNVEEYVVVTYDAPSATAGLYLNGVRAATASIPTNLAPANYGNTFNNWLGRDEFGGDPMFHGSIDELRVWNAAVSPLYLLASTAAGPNVLVTNLTPVLVQVAPAGSNMAVYATQTATVTANFLQVNNVTVSAAATNWSSSNPHVLTVNGNGVMTAVSAGSATVSATVGGVTGVSAAIMVAGNAAVGYWQFNNATNLGLDSSGLGNNLTAATGAPVYSAAGLFGGALYLDGDSTMTTASGAFPIGLPTGSNPYTIAVWEKIDAGCPNDGGFAGWGVNNTGEANDFRLNGNNSLDDYWYANDFVVSGLAVNPMDGAWHEVAVTWDGATETMYVDGANAGTRSPAAPDVQNAGFVVGKTTSDVNFKGWMENLLIANYAMNAQQIAALAVPPNTAPVVNTPLASPNNVVGLGTNVTLTVSAICQPPANYYQWRDNAVPIPGATNATLALTNPASMQSGNYDALVGNTAGTNHGPSLAVTFMAVPPQLPAAYYPLNGDVLDYSGNGNNGANNGVDFVSPGEITLEAGQFDGSSSYATIPESIGLTGSGFTIALWINTTDTGASGQWYLGHGVVDGEQPGVTEDFGTALGGGYFELGIGNPDTTLASTRPINDGTWHHLAATWNMNSGETQIYIDGALNASGAAPAGPRTAPPDLCIGKTPDAAQYFDGLLNDVQLFNSVLSAQQIAVLAELPAMAPIVGGVTVSPSANLYAGSTANFTVATSGNPAPSYYQWLTNGAPLNGATNAALVLSNVTAAQTGAYAVLVGNNYGTNSSSSVTVTVQPASAPVFTMQPMPAAAQVYVNGLVAFNAAVNGTMPIALQWQLDGVDLPGQTAASISLLNVTTNNAGSYTLLASNALGTNVSQTASLTVLPLPGTGPANVLTYQNNNMRTGANTNEYLLTPANVNTNSFGRLFSREVDGSVYAEPLYVAGLNVPGLGTHNAVFAATEHGSVYAFDADDNQGANAQPLWQVSFIDPAAGITPLMPGDVGGCPNIPREECIAATPAIDLAAGTIFIEALTRQTINGNVVFFHRLHALNIETGAEQPNSPVLIGGTVTNATGDTIAFNSLLQQCRTGLLLQNGFIYLGYSAQCDGGAYNGWVMAYNEQTLQQTGIYNDTPNGSQGGIWQGGGGISADESNFLYATTGNGTFGTNYAAMTQYNLSMSFLKFNTNNSLTLTDYFAPYNQAGLSSADLDISAGSSMVLPDSVGSAAHPHLLTGSGKDGTIYLLDRDNLGRFNATADTQIVQELPNAVGTPWNFPVPAYFNNRIFYQGNADVLRAFQISNATLSASAVAVSTVTFGSPGGIPSVSAAGTNNAIVWAIQTDAWASGGAGILHAYNETNLAQELYNSSMDPARDSPGAAVKWTIPMVANGKVYVGQDYALSVYGNSVFLAAPGISPNGGLYASSVTVTLSDASPGASIYYTLNGTAPATNSFLYTGPFVLTNSVGVQAAAFELGATPSGVAQASFINSASVGHGTGLTGNYYSNHFPAAPFTGSPALVRADPAVDFVWTTNGPAASVGSSNYTVKWTGCVQPQFSETYTFYATADDGARLWVNGQEIINQWTNQSLATWQASLPLAAQQFYNVEMDFYYQNDGSAEAQLAWASPSTPQNIIPQTQLYPFTNPPPTVVLSGPTNGSTFTAAATVSLTALADSTNNPLSFVSFYTNGSLAGSVSNVPYALTVTGLAAGNYTLTATAVDGSGLAGASAPVSITVTAASGAPYGLANLTAAPAFYNMPATYTSGPIPTLLSQTGVFSNTPAMLPNNSLIPYAPNTPLWSDNALKVRYMSVPNNGGPATPGQQIAFAPAGQWTFPSGAVFVKTFELQTNLGDPASLLRLETRLLVRDTNGAVYGVTYKWLPDNSDALLLSNSLTEAVLITNAGGSYVQNWYYPSPADCLTCHTAVSGYVLGLNTRQLNGPNTYPSTGVADNQLRVLNRLGLFYPAFNEASITNFEQLSSVTNQNASLAQRARSYLDANCAQCHQPGGTGITFDARYGTPLTNQNILNTAAAVSLGYDHAEIVAPSDIWRSVLYDRMDTLMAPIKMPPLARNTIDSNAVAVMAQWINSLGGMPALAPPALTPAAGIFTNQVTLTLQPPDANAMVFYTLDGTLPTTNSMLYTGPFDLDFSAVVTANAFESNYVNSVAVSALFTIVPPLYTLFAPRFQTNHSFQIQYWAPAGQTYILQSSTDLVHWISVNTNVPAASPFELVDPATTNSAARYYRALSP